MLSIVFSALIIGAFTIWLHAAGIAALMRHWVIRPTLQPTAVFAIIRRLLHVILWLFLLHLAEITLWALFYRWHGLLPDTETAFYFSGVTYTTVGYGDIVLARPWRLLAPLEGLLGVLMCSLSMGYFFVVVNRLQQSQPSSDAST
jgi:Ion channel